MTHCWTSSCGLGRLSFLRTGSIWSGHPSPSWARTSMMSCARVAPRTARADTPMLRTGRRDGSAPAFFFQSDVGSLAVAVNETLRDDKGEDTGKHWWLALLLNLGPPSSPSEPVNVMLCLDSYSRGDTTFDPPSRTILAGADFHAYPMEVQNLSRAGCHVLIRFRAKGDGSAGPLPDPKASVIEVSGKKFYDPEVELDGDEKASPGPEGGGAGNQLHDGYMHFELDSECMTSGEHVLEYGGPGVYKPPLRLILKRRMNVFQRHVASFLRGYLRTEWSLGKAAAAAPATAVQTRPNDEAKVLDVPQQETANDCGFFMLEQIFLVLQLPPPTLRLLAKASVADLVALPWPKQQDILLRKEKLHSGLGSLFSAAQNAGCTDVEVLLRQDAELRQLLRASMVDEASTAFREAVEAWEVRQHCQESGGDAASEAKRRRVTAGSNGHSAT
mmetsp:Transcript_85828/g.276059  ORF Transcript_85828/g.276059 Transcript_85828/m.276059 type:complete len:444 (-) Transcript_85828:27-1358(-)